MIEIYLPDMPAGTTVKCTSVEGVEAIKQLYLSAIADNIHMYNYCKEMEDNETAELFLKRFEDRTEALNVLKVCISEYKE